LLVRPKLFLNFLVLCVLPLILLALFTYWDGLRIAEASLQQEQEKSLSDFKAQLTSLLSEDQNELKRLSAAQPIIDLLQKRSEESSNAIAGDSSETAGSNFEGQPAGRVFDDLRIRVAAIVNRRSHFEAVSLFDQTRKLIFVAERSMVESDSPIIVRTKSLFANQAQPDDRVWSTRVATLFCSPVSNGPTGSRLYCTAPVLTGNDTVQGALVGELTLDSVFSEAAIRAVGSPAGMARAGGGVATMFVVLDRGGRILYHTNEALKHQPVSASMPYFQPVASQMFSGQSGRQDFTSTTGDAYSTNYVRIPELDVSLAVASNRELALANARRTGRLSLIAAVFLGMVAALLLTLYWQRKSRGIERVTEGVEAIAKGKLDYRIDLRSSDDLRPLADNLGLMTQQLREQIARESETRQFQSFVRLSAILTHDLKNAIEALSLTVANMGRHFDNPEFRLDAMKTLRGATENLKALVARLSNPVTTLSGEHKRPKPVDLVPMLQRVISMTAAQASEDHQTRTNLPPTLYSLVDAERMEKVIENLIINALEAMRGKEGTLTIEAGMTDNGKSFFSVGDTGEGMSQRFIEERLFHPFATTKKLGVGLGLYTCREVVRANGGSIEVDSQPGAGTTFRVVLPSAAIDNSGGIAPHNRPHR
jgi:signal transduction histidine kinase